MTTLSVFDQVEYTLILVVVLLGVWWMLRFAVFLPRRTRGWQGRLALPKPAEVEARWKVQLPPSLERIFRSDLIQRSDFYLAQPGARRTQWLWIDHFIPLTARDVSAWLALTSVPGIPIAMDGRDRAYYLPFADLRRGGQVPVMLHIDNQEYREVASSVEQWMSFEPKTVGEYKASEDKITA